MSRTGWRGNIGLVEGNRNDLVTGEIANIADFDHEIGARLVLNIEGEIHAVRQLVCRVVDTQRVWLA